MSYEQIRMTDETGEQIILPAEVEEKEKKAQEYQAAINRAQALIKDAKARYIKEKTRARSRKAALERDAALLSPRFRCLELYDRFEDIQDNYGCDGITAAERDRLEDLWKEREEIKNHRDDNGVYSDFVTKALWEAEKAVLNLWDEEIEDAEVLRNRFEKQRKEAEEERAEWFRKQEESMRRWASDYRKLSAESEGPQVRT